MMTTAKKAALMAGVTVGLLAGVLGLPLWASILAGSGGALLTHRELA